jgi:hypothetical protein
VNDLDQAKMNEREATLFACAICSKTPTCPMLEDGVWAEVWAGAQTHGLREPKCTASQHARVAFRCDDKWHSRACEKGVGRVRELLCMFCAERALGRALALDDLKACPANYGTYLMVTRAQAYVNRVAEDVATQKWLAYCEGLRVAHEELTGGTHPHDQRDEIERHYKKWTDSPIQPQLISEERAFEWFQAGVNVEATGDIAQYSHLEWSEAVQKAFDDLWKREH